ncbi:MAG: TrkA family potassium uptake protein [Chloroflexi bacterium]|nr:TrkA family potassium uptake protein [Chloroflexota bacterium]MDA1146206.1 TrkA family potassium uptake protein [Chloroflexota bacterium]
MQVVVLGLGRFGSQLAEALAEEGHEVLAIDISENEVQRVADRVTKAAIADMTDEDALRDLGVGNMDIGVVATAFIEASVLAAMNLQSLGVPEVYAKARSDRHATMLRRIGVQRVVEPEKEGGLRFAHLLRLRQAKDYLSVSRDYGIAIYEPPPRLYGTTLGQLDEDHSTRRLLMLMRDDEVQLNPIRTQTIKANDRLIFSGSDEDLAKEL